MLTVALLIIAAALAIAVAYAVVLPRVATVSRSALIAAPPEMIYPLLNNSRAWQLWLPWATLDPGVSVSFAGPESGPNAALSWEGNWQIGAGTMTLIEGEVNDYIRVRLDIVRPYPSTSFADFLFQPEDNGTRLIWSMTSDRSLIGRLEFALLRADSSMGELFAIGLQNLNELVLSQKAGPIEEAQ